MTAQKLARAEGLPSGGSRGKVSRPKKVPPQNIAKPKQPWRMPGAHCSNCVSAKPFRKRVSLLGLVLWCLHHEDHRLALSCCESWEKNKTERSNVSRETYNSGRK